jgi:hypothetical protein
MVAAMISDRALRPIVLLFAALSVATIVASMRGDSGTNTASRLATMDALVHDGTFIIDHSVFVFTLDKVMRDGHFYSSKPPLWSTVGAGVYWVINRTTGQSLRVAASRPRAVWMLTLILGLGPHLVLLLYAFRLLRVWTQDHLAILGAFACFALGWLGVGYAVSINNHTPAATLLLMAFYYAHRAKRGEGSRRAWWLCGLCAGLAPTIDLSAIFVSSALALYLLRHDWRTTLSHFALAALPPLALHFVLTYLASGGLEPVYLHHELYHYAGSYWNAPMGIDALHEPRSLYLFHMLLGHHGLLTMTPVLWLALVGLGREFGRAHPRRLEALVVAGSLVALVVFYLFTTTNYGGLCVGFRWLLPAVPLLLLYVASFITTARHRLLAVALVAIFLVVNSYSLWDALATPWQVSRWQMQLAALGFSSPT